MILALSPHLDDAVLSLGGALGRWSAAGEQVVLATVFTGSARRPAAVALSDQTGLEPDADVDHMARRRQEDRNAALVLGLSQAIHLDLPEARYRGYESAAQRSGPIHPDDDAADAVTAVLDELLQRLGPARVLTCQGRGGHVDHRVVLTALERLGVPTERWRDIADALEGEPGAPALGETAIALTREDLERKLSAYAAYSTQIPRQFGTFDAAHRTLRDLARGEARRLGVAGYAEALDGPAVIAAARAHRSVTTATP